MRSGACFMCGSLDNFLKDCSERVDKEVEPTLKSSDPISRGRPPRYPKSARGGHRVERDFTIKSKARAPTRTYAICAREEASPPDVIMGTFSLYGIPIVALIDSGSTHLYVCMKLVSSKELPVEFTEYMIKVSNLLGKHVLVNKVCKKCPLMIREHCFLNNLMLFPFDEFNVILGMDWFTLHDAIVNCRQKVMELRCENGETLQVEPDESNIPSIVISSMSAQKYMRKGCKAYLAYVLNTKEFGFKIKSVPVVCDYPNVFPEELLGLPPIREVEFSIDLVPGKTPILIAPYQMAPTKLKELKSQLQELTDNSFTRPSFST
ncbi:uncharacterized protein [Gossypium hirsutum]|uniref:RVP_2 domain-containing protein n=1 Tax=Gossypium hirsutum TaxID=3635 RepID=A0A1U8NPW6_GOSHI|nr:uncharacterized protein LOC107949855 [Gossypium hirsutum]